MSARRVLTLLDALGVIRLWRYWQRDAVVILTVHGVMDPGVPHQWLPLRSRLAAARLDECLTLLRRYYHFVPLDTAVDMLAGRLPLQPRTMALTRRRRA